VDLYAHSPKSTGRVQTLHVTNTHSSHGQYRDVQDCSTDAGCDWNPTPSQSVSLSAVLSVQCSSNISGEELVLPLLVLLYHTCAAINYREPSRFQPTSIGPM
jgi:hypothetical protein